MIRFPLFCLLSPLIFMLLVVTQASANVTGIVRGVQENPITGALVTFINEQNPSDIYSGYTNAAGRYDIAITALSVGNVQPAPFTLNQNHPNPFNPSTTITFSTAEPGAVTLTVYNLLGQRVRTLVSGTISAGEYSVLWDGRDDSGFVVGAGVYLYRLAGSGKSETRKMLLMDGGAAGVWSMAGRAASVSAPIAAKPEAATWTITITGDEIESREINGMEIADGGAYDFYVIFTGELMNFHLVPIPGGTFEMGVAWEEVSSLYVMYTTEMLYGLFGPPHGVILSDFEMSAYEITNAQYVQFLNEAFASGEVELINGDPYGKGGEWDGKRFIDLEVDVPVVHTHPERDCQIMIQNGSFKVEQAERRKWPVAAVTWYGAKAFAVHYGLDLPTEAEWEFAAGGGTLEYRYATDDGTLDPSKANYTIGYPIDVGSYPPNPFGLYDMSGNIKEWCNDWNAPYPSLADETHDGNDYDSPPSYLLFNPVGPATGSSCIYRGGTYSGGLKSCSTVNRDSYGPDAISGTSVMPDFGFRVARR